MTDSMQNMSLAVSAVAIPYHPSLRDYAGSIASTVLMVQLDFYFALQNKRFEDGFYKFLEPNSHAKYRDGDSWAEVLHVTADEFRTAFKKIGIQYPSLSAYRQACKNGDPFQNKFYLSYVDRKSNLTFYLRNHTKVDAVLDKVFRKVNTQGNEQKQDETHAEHSSCKNPSTGDGEIHPLTCKNPAPDIEKTGFHSTEITSEITPKTTTTQVQPVVSGGFENLIFEPIIKQYQPQLISCMTKANITDQHHAQDLIDELAGTLEAGNRGELKVKIGRPVLWLKTLATGNFERDRCFKVQARRRLGKTSSQLSQLESKTAGDRDADRKKIADALSFQRMKAAKSEIRTS